MIKRASRNGELPAHGTDKDMKGGITLDQNKKCYTVAEVQNILGISRQAVYQLIYQKKFKTVLLDRKYRIVKASFDAWLDGEKEES